MAFKEKTTQIGEIALHCGPIIFVGPIISGISWLLLIYPLILENHQQSRYENQKFVRIIETMHSCIWYLLVLNTYWLHGNLMDE